MELNTNNVNIEDLKKMASIIAMEQANMQNKVSPKSAKNIQIPKQNVSAQVKQNIVPQPKQSGPKKVVIVSNTSEDVADIVPLVPQQDESVLQSGRASDPNAHQTNNIDDDSFAIMGMNIPKYTLYLIIVLIIIAIIIWYMSKDDRPKKKKKDEDEE
jgi:hypothetical protein